MISVLYVDDEPDLLDIAQIYLQQDGKFRVSTSTSALQVLESLSIDSYDAIISDYQMPGMNGIDFLKAVRQVSRDLPFILFTGRGREEVVIEAINNGADFYLQKGGDPKAQFAELAHKIRQAVRRKQAERSLHDSERRLSDIIDFLPDATFAIDQSGHVIAWNRAIEEMTGIPSRSMLGRGDLEYAIPLYGTRRPLLIDLINEPDDTIAQFYSNIFRAGNTLTAESIFTHPKGHKIATLVKACYLYNQAGEITGAIESIRDITERKQAEDSLVLLKTSVDQAYDEVFWLDFEGNILYVNEAACRTTGYSRDELLTMKIFALDSDFPPEVWSESVADLRQRKNQFIRTRHRRKDGVNIDVEIMTTYVRKGDREYSFAFVRDITERKLVEDTIRESEAKYRNLADLLPQMVLELDPDLRITYANRHACNVLGITEADIEMGISALSFIEPLQHGQLKEILKNYNEGGRGSVPGEPQEYRALRKDGTTFPINVYFAPIIKNDTLHGFRGVLVDISTRRKIEEELRIREDQLQRLASNARDMIYRMSLPDGRYEYVSPASVALTGYTPEEFYQNPTLIRSLIHPAWQPYFREQWSALLEKNVPPVYEYQIIDKEGRTRWVNQRNVLVTDNRGEPVAIEGVVTDITGSKEIEQELQRSEERFLAVSENAGSWIWEVDPDGLYRYSSPAIFSILGYRPEELVGQMHFYDLFDPAVRNDLKAVATDAFSRHEPFRGFINLNRRRDGTPVLLRTSGTPFFDEHGRFSGYRGVDEDITEQRNAEVALRESEERFRGMAERSSDLIFILDSSMSPTYVSPSARSIIGYDPEELVGKPREFAAATIFSQSSTMFIEAMQENMNGKSVDSLEMQIQKKDGTTVYVNAHAIPLMQDGVFTGAQVSMRDITRRIEVEIALRESEERFRGIAERSSDLIFVLDHSMSPTYVSPSARSIIGYDPEELVGKPPEFASATIFSQSGPAFLKAVEENSKGNAIDNLELPILRKDGTVGYVSMYTTPLMQDGIITGIQVSMRDITQRKEAEIALRESEEKFRSFVENATDIVFSLTQEGILTYASPRWTELLGHDLSEVIGRQAGSFIHPKDLPRINECFRQVIHEEKKVSGVEYRVQLADGNWQWHSLSLSPLRDSSGRIIGAEGICHDITERKKTEDALRFANRQLNLLSSVTRHDINNKIMLIFGYLGIIEREFRDPALTGYLEEMKKATRAIQSQIDFTRIYQNLGIHTPQWIRLDTVLPHLNIPSAISLDSDVDDISVYADPVFEKVFSNILDNSIRHGQRVTMIRVSSHLSGRDLIMVWEDDGIGIPEDEKERIFERGFGKNTGLGMFLVREILSLTGITITETGEPGKGARFEMLVPAGMWQSAQDEL